jgi:hypothetical protein
MNPPSGPPTLSSLYLRSSSGRPPLRIGILLDGNRLIRVFAEIIRDIQQSGFAKIELLIYNSPAAAPIATAPAPLPLRLLRAFSANRRKALLWNLYNRLDRKLHTLAADPVEEEDCSALLQGIESLRVSPITQRFVQRFPEEAVEAIRAQDLDVLLRFGFNILRGGILHAARHGVWSFHHGDPDSYRGGPAHFWEMYERNPLSGAVLQILTEELDAGKILAKTLFATAPGFSLLHNRVQPYFGSAHLMIQKLWELHQYGWERLQRAMVPLAPYAGKRKIYRTPTNSEIARWLIPELARSLLRRSARVLHLNDRIPHWRIAVRSGSRGIESAEGKPDMGGFRWIESPKGHFYADPFLFEKNGKTWLFFEDYLYRDERGVISCAELSAEGRLGDPQVVLDTGTHASYPHVFESGGDIWMVPETAAAGGTWLYRATQFPSEWKREAALLPLPGRDATLFQDQDLWWMFVSLQDPRGRGLVLYLYFSRELAGPWQFHPANPISADVRNIRGAGRIFRHKGFWLRPAQDCSRQYGYGFTLFRIMKLTPEEYEEQPIASVGPDWDPGLLATHTYNRAGAHEVVDGQVFRSRRRIM